MSGAAVKDEEANQTLLFKRLKNNFANKRLFHGPSILLGTKENLLTFLFTKTFPSIFNARPPPAYLRCFWFRRAVVASIQLVPKYIAKVKVIFKYFALEQSYPSKIGANGHIYQMQLSMGAEQ